MVFYTIPLPSLILFCLNIFENFSSSSRSVFSSGGRSSLVGIGPPCLLLLFLPPGNIPDWCGILIGDVRTAFGGLGVGGILCVKEDTTPEVE